MNMGHMHNPCEKCTLDCLKCKLYIEVVVKDQEENEMYEDFLKWQAKQ
jgi:hypothetical protein